MLSSKANSVQLVNNAAALLRRTAAPFLVILSIVLAGRAQQSNAPDPDYSSVKDILRGRRTLLSINDLVIGGTVLKTSDGSKIEDKNISELPGFQRRTGDLETLAHLFDSKAGTLVYLHEKALYAIDPVLQSTTSLNLNEFTSLAAIASADFKLDGHQEIVIASRSGVRLVSAVDPVDFSKGLLAGPKAAFQAFSNFRPAVALGDFNGDGFPEIAVVYETLLENRRRLNIYQVDPQTLALDLKHSQLLADHNSGSVVAVSLAVGQFGTTLRDQLLLGYFSTGNLLAFMSFGFDESLAPILKDTRTVPGLTLQELDLGTGRFNPASPFSQVAAKLDQGRANVQVGIISLDSDLKVRLPNFVALPGVACTSGDLAVGNFARTEPVSTDPSESQLSLKYQLAISSSNCAGSLGVNIYNVDPATAAGQDFIIDPNAVLSRSLPQAADYGLPIVAGDIQGRSVVLGEPTKVVIQETAQPSLIAAMPPMHVDYIRPAGGGESTLLNLSAIPDRFTTVYQIKKSDTSQSSNTNTSSWSFGAQIGVGASVEIGSVENGLGVEVSATAKAAQDIKTINEKEFGSYQSSSFEANVKTGFADHIWFTDSRFNVYIYPVLNHSVCPASEPKCEKSVPLTIQFSAPDEIERHQVNGNLIPWYQPPWEPGNVFHIPQPTSSCNKLCRTSSYFRR